ncbi:hypothetical protein [Hymenobacter guriensis]|uniref:Uncharacterized protein n=1 Tax=Hymenobacter guriensis TaxID=2793065 RepID=A0ABS0KX83_9BACT|nr:hypothetical protein [Hymenobacter guriensis]MBG8552473.1 hypothetical protein [Hymenobacter guriensis]
MKTFASLLVVALLASAPLHATQAAAPEKAPSATTSLTAKLPLFGKKSIEKSRVSKRKQTLRRRKRMFSF